jgi:hypothetical protein
LPLLKTRPSTWSMSSAAAYAANCLHCHGPASTTRCAVEPTGGRIGCQLGTNREAVSDSPFTDHQVRAASLGTVTGTDRRGTSP